LEYKNDDPFSGEGKTIDVTDDDLPFWWMVDQ
jgi:hypothetical protein